jgi:hypothetical protein
MKHFLLAICIFTSASAFAYDASEGRSIYYCTSGVPFVNGVNPKMYANIKSNNVIEGSLNGQAFSFINKTPKLEAQGVLVYSDPNSKIQVRVQRPAYGDGMQDALWGQISNGPVKVNVNCYLGDG